jgi:hypothetical protein
VAPRCSNSTSCTCQWQWQQQQQLQHNGHNECAYLDCCYCCYTAAILCCYCCYTAAARA